MPNASSLTEAAFLVCSPKQRTTSTPFAVRGNQKKSSISEFSEMHECAPTARRQIILPDFVSNTWVFICFFIQPVYSMAYHCFFWEKVMKKTAFIVMLVLISFIAEAKKAKVLVDDCDNPWFQYDAPVKKFKTAPIPPKRLETKMDNEKIKIDHDPKKKENLRSEWKFLLVRPNPTHYNTKQVIKKEIRVPEKMERIDNSFGLKGLDSEPDKVEKSAPK